MEIESWRSIKNEKENRQEGTCGYRTSSPKQKPRASRRYREKRRVLRELGDGAERSREMQTH